MDRIDQIKIYQDLIVEEMVGAMGFKNQDWVKNLLKWMFNKPSMRFSEICYAFDTAGKDGMIAGCKEALKYFCDGYTLANKVDIPTEGPLLILANHPGTYDGLVVASEIPRNDLKLVVSGMPIVRSFKYINKHMIFSSLDHFERANVIKESVEHLKTGGSLLILPGGGINPDPGCMEGAEAAVETWSESVEIFLRKVPETNCLVSIVSDVLQKRFLSNPFIHIRKGRRNKQRLAEFAQIITQMYKPESVQPHPTVSFAEPVNLEQLLKETDNRRVIQPIIRRAKELIRTYHTDSTRERVVLI